MSPLASRIAPLEPPYAPDIQAQFDRIMRGAPPLMLFRVVAGNPRAWDKFRAASLLDGGPLTLREREIVIDRTCARTGCEYEWGVHILIFAKAAGLTEEQIRATVLGSADAACWSTPEQALIAAVDALHARATLNDDEFEALSAHYDDAKIFEIMLLCGFYRTVSYLANGLALPLEEKAARFPKAT
jgi:alkylhydroperoxidase family enzyme